MSRYIDAEWLRSLYADFKDYGGRTDWETPVANVLATIDDAPSIDIVRCKECRWYKDFDGCFFSTASMGKYGTDYMATLLMRAADTIEMLSEKVRAEQTEPSTSGVVRTEEAVKDEPKSYTTWASTEDCSTVDCPWK